MEDVAYVPAQSGGGKEEEEDRRQKRGRRHFCFAQEKKVFSERVINLVNPPIYILQFNPAKCLLTSRKLFAEKQEYTNMCAVFVRDNPSDRLTRNTHKSKQERGKGGKAKSR